MKLKKVIFTIGISGSGKSTWAKRFKQNSEQEVYILERDELREELEPGYYLKKLSKEVEKKVTTIARQRLKEKLLDSKTDIIIISDTNLNRERLESNQFYCTEVVPFCEIEEKIFKTSFGITLCLARNANREKKVPSELVINQYKRFWSLYGTNYFHPVASSKDFKDKTFIFVSDIHSDYLKLVDLIEKYPSDKYYYIFAGDINDTRKENLTSSSLVQKDSFYLTYSLIRSLVSRNEATLLNSNHQKNLIKTLRGQRTKLSGGMENTFKELCSREIINYEGEISSVEDHFSFDKTKFTASPLGLEIADWLDSRPYTFSFYFQDAVYCCAHAYPKCPGFFPHKKEEGLYIYGISKDGEQVKWWENKRVLTDIYEDKRLIRVAGHYHTTYLKPELGAIILDSECGYDGGKLGLAIFNDTQGISYDFL